MFKNTILSPFLLFCLPSSSLLGVNIYIYPIYTYNKAKRKDRQNGKKVAMWNYSKCHSVLIRSSKYLTLENLSKSGIAFIFSWEIQCNVLEKEILHQRQETKFIVQWYGVRLYSLVSKVEKLGGRRHK